MYGLWSVGGREGRREKGEMNVGGDERGCEEGRNIKRKGWKKEIKN